MSSAGFSRRTRKRDRTKRIVAILLGLMLIAAILLRTRWTAPLLETPSIDGVSETVDSAVDVVTDNAVVDVVKDGADGLGNALAVDGSGEAGDDAVSAEIELDTPDAAPAQATLEGFSEPLVNSAVIGYDGDGNELLTIAGTGDTRCESIRFIIDGKEVGSSVPDADGSWAITMADLPKAGSYMSEIECDAEGNVYTAAPRSFELPEAPAVADAVATEPGSASAESAEVSTDNSDQVNEEADAAEVETETEESVDEANAEAALVEEAQDAETPDEQPAVDPNVKQPEFWIAQDLAKYNGGPLLIKGTANRGQIIEVILDSGTTQVSDTATADDNGDWAMRAMLTEPGNYSVRAQLAGTSAEPATNVVVPNGLVFGSKGDCIGKTPAYGTIEGKNYIVNHCEFFSLIADRLGVTFAELRAANQQIINLDYITAGDTINIP